MKQRVIRWRGGYIRYESSFNGKAILRVSKSRTKANGKLDCVQEEIEIDRSDLYCIVKALKSFADKEREAVQAMPL